MDREPESDLNEVAQQAARHTLHATRSTNHDPRSTAAASGFWPPPWGYPQAVTVAVALVGIGAIIQGRHPALEVPLPAPPWNWVAVFAPPVLLGALRMLLPRQAILAGLGGIPMAVVSVLAVAVLSIPAAVWPQGAEAPELAHRFGLDHVFSSFPMAAALALLMTNLTVSGVRRLWSLRAADLRFTMVHAGLLIAIGAALAGSAAMERIQVPLRIGEPPVTHGILRGEPVPLPFALSLVEFRREAFAPMLLLGSSAATPEGDWVLARGQELLAAGTRERMGGYTVEVLEFLPSAAVVDGVPRSFAQRGAGPAARVAVRDASGNAMGEGWLHSTTMFGEELFLRLSPTEMLLLDPPRPRLFESTIRIHDGAGTREETVRVNEPLTIGHWKLYQMGYDEEFGDASRLSVLEAIGDPAWPVVAFGAWMAILGCLWSFWSAAQGARPAEDRP